MKKVVMVLFCSFSFSAFAQLPIPITPDWLKGSEKASGILNTTHVTLTGNNYVVVQTNIVARSRGFKILGLLSIRGASYTEAMSRLYSKAKITEGRSQAIANMVYETGGLNLILFQIPKVRIRGDLIEFTGDSMDEEPAAVRVRGSVDEPNAAREQVVPRPDPSRVRE